MVGFVVLVHGSKEGEYVGLVVALVVKTEWVMMEGEMQG